MILAILLLAVAVPLIFPVAASGSQCDQYGDCISPAVSTVHGNPDGSFYPGDSFYVYPNPSAGTNMSVSSVSWSFNSTEFSRNGYYFVIVGNKTGSFTISVTVLFHNLPGTKVDNMTSVSSPIRDSVSITVRKLVLVPTAGRLTNVTASNGFLLRNPDGSFYKNDSFCIAWSTTFLYYQSRPDINVSAQPASSIPLKLLNSTTYTKNNYAGTTCFAVTGSANYKPYNLTLVFSAVNHNYNDMHLARMYYVDLQAPFTVVQYSPYFSHYTYMQYNSTLQTSYLRPFITIARYDGNNPGFAANYTGDIDTKKIVAVNDTGERAWINNFTFSSTGFRMSTNYTSEQLSNDTQFIPNQNATMKVNYMNSTKLSETREMNWGNRYYKYYFVADMSVMKYVENGTQYYQVVENAQSKNYAGGTYNAFTTNYDYSPVFYNGFIIFQGNETGLPINITLTIHNTFPLNYELMSEVNATFHNDPKAIRDLKVDLSNDAYNYTEILRPIAVNTTSNTYYFLLNQTNIMTQAGGELPYLTINASGGARLVSYEVNINFAQLMELPSDFPSFPSQNGTTRTPFNFIQGYYVDNLQVNTGGAPVNFTSSAYTNIFFYAPGLNTAYPGPIGFPGNLTNRYSFFFGQNTTIPVNVQGGGVDLVAFQPFSPSSYKTTVFASNMSGGVTNFWVASVSYSPPSSCVGTLESIGPLYVCKLFIWNPTFNSPLTWPPGFTGIYGFNFNVPEAGLYAIGYDGAWGSSSIITTFTDRTISQGPQSADLWAFATFIAVVVIGMYFAGRWFKYRQTRKSSPDQ